MDRNSDIVDRSYKFSLEIIKLVNLLPKNTSASVISKQIMRSGTSIGANIEEAQGAASKKEARETRYWLRLIKDSGILKVTQVKSLINECDSIVKILTAIVKTAQNNMKQG